MGQLILSSIILGAILCIALPNLELRPFRRYSYLLQPDGDVWIKVRLRTLSGKQKDSIVIPASQALDQVPTVIRDVVRQARGSGDKIE